jgi:hypothetical protein
MRERRTKIIATVGPASVDPDVLEELIAAGADVLRLNFSHADLEWHAAAIEAIRAASARAGREIAILGDTDGPDDLDQVDFCAERDVDLLAISFVSSAADVEKVAERLRSRGSDIPLIAKIEKREAAEDAGRSSAPRAAGSWSPAATSASNSRWRRSRSSRSASSAPPASSRSRRSRRPRCWFRWSAPSAPPAPR